MIKGQPRRGGQAWTRDLCSRSGAGAGGGFLECQELLRAEGLVVNLGGRLNEILEVSPGVVLSECQMSKLKERTSRGSHGGTQTRSAFRPRR